MATALLGWELGSGWGHVDPLIPLAHALARSNWNPVLVLRNLVDPWPLLRHIPYPILPAPFLPAPLAEEDTPFLAASYADILARSGFDDEQRLFPLVRAWDHLLTLVRPDVILADHSPALCLAALGVAPLFVIGNGFFVPPVHQPVFPPLLANQTPQVAESELLTVVQGVQQKRGRPIPTSLPEILTGTARFLTVLPQLDPYQNVRREPALGPLQPLPPCAPLAGAPNYFAYLSDDILSSQPVLAILAGSGFPGRAYLRGARPSSVASLQHPALELLSNPAEVGVVLREASVVIHHGGAALAQSALAMGRPQLLFPSHLEQALNARCLERLGVALVLTNHFTTADVLLAVRRLLTEPAFTQRAQQVAHDIQAAGPWKALTTIVEHCEPYRGSR